MSAIYFDKPDDAMKRRLIA